MLAGCPGIFLFNSEKLYLATTVLHFLKGTVCSSWFRLLHGSIAGSAEICIDFTSSIFCVFMDISEVINYAVKVLPGNVVVALPNT